MNRKYPAKPTIPGFHPNDWPNWPFLPIKNYRIRTNSGLPKIAVLVEAGFVRGTPSFMIKYDTNMWSLMWSLNAGPLDLKDWEKVELLDLERDGWEVD